MRKVETGRRPAFLAVTRTGLLSVALVLSAALSGCTTVEGTNALSDPVTFEREVMTSTLVGLGVIPGEKKQEPTNPRGPLVIPKAGAPLPAPQPSTTVAQLPVDSDTVQINTAGLSPEDLQRLRNARVVDLRSLSGRPLTEAETRALTARMTAAQMQANGKRPLYLPPDEYFTTTVAGKDTVCLAKNGDLVPVTDPACPAEIRKALGH